jgi:hypothetical protein
MFDMQDGEILDIYPTAYSDCYYSHIADGWNIDYNPSYRKEYVSSQYTEVVTVYFGKKAADPTPTPTPTPEIVYRNISVVILPYGSGEARVVTNTTNESVVNGTIFRMPVGERVTIVATPYPDNRFDIIIDGIDASLNETYTHVVGESDALIKVNFKSTINVSTPGDLDGNAEVTENDLDLMIQAYLNEDSPDSDYDLNGNGIIRDAGDLVLMARAVYDNDTSILSREVPETIAPDSGIVWNGSHYSAKIPNAEYLIKQNESGWSATSLSLERHKTRINVTRYEENNSWLLEQSYLPSFWYVSSTPVTWYGFGEEVNATIEKSGEAFWWQLTSIIYDNGRSIKYGYNKSADANGEYLSLDSVEITGDETDKLLATEIPYLGMTIAEAMWATVPLGPAEVKMGGAAVYKVTAAGSPLEGGIWARIFKLINPQEVATASKAREVVKPFDDKSFWKGFLDQRYGKIIEEYCLGKAPTQCKSIDWGKVIEMENQKLLEKYGPDFYSQLPPDVKGFDEAKFWKKILELEAEKSK